MDMKRLIILIILFVALGTGLLFSQDTTDTVGEADEELLGKDAAQQRIESLTISNFEDDGFWTADISQDQGIILIKARSGVPKDKIEKDAKRLEQEAKIQGLTAEEMVGEYVLGTKVIFYKRSSNAFFVEAAKPIPIPGITKTISVWVIGRNYNHVLKIVVMDYYGNKMELTVGKLNHQGWKKMTVAIPPNIIKSDYHFTEKEGVRVVGFKI